MLAVRLLGENTAEILCSLGHRDEDARAMAPSDADFGAGAGAANRLK